MENLRESTSKEKPYWVGRITLLDYCIEEKNNVRTIEILQHAHIIQNYVGVILIYMLHNKFKLRILWWGPLPGLFAPPPWISPTMGVCPSVPLCAGKSRPPRSIGLFPLPIPPWCGPPPLAPYAPKAGIYKNLGAGQLLGGPKVVPRPIPTNPSMLVRPCTRPANWELLAPPPLPIPPPPPPMPSAPGKLPGPEFGPSSR